jgi:poly-gamma-glutamate capsule biosynthesis protein CapA/YwtB (metallophosphatase superfamily)
MNKSLISSLLLLISFPAFLTGQYTGTSRLNILFAGDIMGHDSQIEAALTLDSGIYDYRSCFEYLKPIIRDADIVLGNLEVTFAGPPYKGYPRFSSPDELCVALDDAGFDILINANNHALDRGKDGLERTLSILEKNNMIFTGCFKSKEHRNLCYPLLIEKNNIMLAILNYTYGTNELKASPPNIVNYIDTAIIREDIHKALAGDPDFIIACLHWGREYEREANESQKDLARWLFTQGVNVIIGSHPHVVQPVRIIYNDPDSTDFQLVVYSLGNFISNQRDRYRDGGIIFELELVKTEKTNIAGYSYLPVWVHKPRTEGKQLFRLIPANMPEDRYESFNLTGEDREKFEQFKTDTRTHLKNIPEYNSYPESIF